MSGISATYGFLGNPDDIEVGTGSYTVPAGYYGFATVHQTSTNFVIDSVTALVALESQAGGGTASGGSHTVFTPNNDCQVTVAFSGPGTLTINSGTSLGTAGTYNVFLKAGVPLVILSGSSTGYYYSAIPVGGPAVANYWLKPGTAISGGRYVVQLFQT